MQQPVDGMLVLVDAERAVRPSGPKAADEPTAVPRGEVRTPGRSELDGKQKTGGEV
jgi:hypothetical protein